METEELKTQKEEEGINLAEYGMMFLAHWRWFLLAVFVSMSIAVLHVLSTTPMYTRSTLLLIKDDKSDGTNSLMKGFENMGLLESRSNLNNEMQIISAPTIMKEVAHRLHLDLQLSVENRFRTTPLYNDTPIFVKFNGQLLDEQSFTFKIHFQQDGTMVLKDFINDGEPVNTNPIQARFDQKIKTPVGILAITKTPLYKGGLEDQTIDVQKLPIDVVGNIYSSRLSVSLTDKDATILNLSVNDEIPDRADDVLLTLIDVYNEKWLQDKNLIADSSAKFIEERLEAISKELGDVDQDISEYKSRNLIPDVEAVSAMYMQRSTKNQDELLNLTNQLGMARFIRDYLKDKSRENMLLPSNTGIQSSGIESQISEYNQIMLLRNDLVANSNEKDPLVTKYTTSLTAMKTAILRSIDNQIAQIEQQIANVHISEGSTNEQLASNPKQAEHLLSVGRQQKVKEALYIYLLQKREENELSKAFTAYNSRIVQPPFGSDSPTSPRKQMVMLVAFVLGIVVPGGIIFLREALNNKVRSRKDLENINVPYIGDIPLLPGTGNISLKRDKRPESRIVVSAKSHDRINEAFRILRTNLDYFINTKGLGKVIMTTSFNPSSGKTFIASNLAKTVSLKGQRVLVLDMDLRRKSLSKMLHRHNEDGVSSYLAGVNNDLSSLIIKEAFGENIDVLPVGMIPPNPTELLLSDRMKQLFNILRNSYDYIFVDCPPIDIVADTSIVKTYADVTLFILRVGLADRRLINTLDEIYRSGSFNNLCVLLNATKKLPGNYYDYKYAYSYKY